MTINQILKNEFNIKLEYVDNIITLIDEGNTIPFIARYRKELTGALDDQVLRELANRLQYLRNLNEKKEQTKKLIDEQGNLTDELTLKIDNAVTLTEIDDIYRPFRPKRRTKATIAKEKGLQPLADVIYAQETKEDIKELAQAYVNEELEVNSAEEAISGALDIIAETISDDANVRAKIRKAYYNNANLFSEVVGEEGVYGMYDNYTESVKTILPHRVLALNRGEKEKVLNVKLQIDDAVIWDSVKNLVKDNESTKEYMKLAVEDSCKRLIIPSIEREIRNELTEKAEEGAIKVFGKNLGQLIMQPPIHNATVLALDPGFRTGCKVAVVDATGKVLDTGVVYPTQPHNKVEETKKTLKKLIDTHDVNLIVIGNGTASRETELVVVEMIKELDKEIYYCIVNEAGASVYSASKLGAEEFPDYDVALRSAVSIARRIQDPMAELVKIDPKSIGVGQYQHDMNQKKLTETLGGVVEDCVNKVGVDVNTASASLLSYVAGISSTLAKNIQLYREENGVIKSRSELKKVSKLGPKAYLQCAGFIRVRESKNPLDNSAVHPESYKVAEQILESLGYTLKDFGAGKAVIDEKSVNTKALSEQLGIGEHTVTDIVKELIKPNRDPRSDMPQSILRNDVLDMKDLTEGMELMGTVRNVIDFGAFVDIGVHQDGLVHISQMTDKYIKHPLDVVSVGDIVKVKVLSVDVPKKRISLTMKY